MRAVARASAVVLVLVLVLVPRFEVMRMDNSGYFLPTCLPTYLTSHLPHMQPRCID